MNSGGEEHLVTSECPPDPLTPSPSPSPYRVYELPAQLPANHTLKVIVMDYDHTSADDLIGETTVDLESRYLTQHRAMCGLPETFSAV